MQVSLRFGRQFWNFPRVLTGHFLEGREVSEHTWQQEFIWGKPGHISWDRWDRAERRDAVNVWLQVWAGHLFFQGGHSLLQVELQPLVGLRQELVHRVGEALVVFIVHPLPLPRLREERERERARETGECERGGEKKRASRRGGWEES